MNKKYNYLTIGLVGLGAMLFTIGFLYLITNYFQLTTNKTFLAFSLLGTLTTFYLNRKIKNMYFAYTLSSLCSLFTFSSLYFLSQTYTPTLNTSEILVFWTLGACILSYLIPNLPILYQITLTGPIALFVIPFYSYSLFSGAPINGIMPAHMTFLIMSVVLTLCAFSIIYSFSTYAEV